MSARVTRQQRYTAQRRCPICGGADGDRRGSGRRCHGYVSADGAWARCSREDQAGSLDLKGASGTYAHRMHGPCACGREHGPARDPATRGESETVYAYHDEQGALLYEVVRRAGKRFVQRRPGGSGGWIWRLDDVRRVPYRLPDLIAAPLGQVVYVVEGERDVDTLVGLGAVATSSPQGAGKWHLVAAVAREVLAGRDVVIIADADEPGRAHARQVAESLRGVARRVRVIEPPPPDNDVTDYVAAGHSLEDIAALADVDDAEERAAIEEEPPISGVSETTSDDWPAPLGDDAYHGPLGALVRLVAPHTEADPAAILVQALAVVGCMAGPPPPHPEPDDTHLEYACPAAVRIGVERHPPRLHVVVVGGTARGRKGTSLSIVRAVAQAVDGHLDGRWWSTCAQPGISTGEGIIAAVRDWEPPLKRRKSQDDDDELPPRPRDKRLLLVEEELGRPLAAMKREGSTLSMVLRQAWDSAGDLGILTRADPIRATATHIVLLGHITPVELHRLLDDVSRANGLANRVLWVASRRQRCLPVPDDVMQLSGVADQIALLAGAIGATHARGDAIIALGEAAREEWDRIYPALSGWTDPHADDERDTGRAEAQVMRIALVYALLDQAMQIDLPHLRAALEVWRYCRDGARHIFRARERDARESQLAADMDRLRAAMTPDEVMSRTAIMRATRNNIPAGRLDAALTELERLGEAEQREPRDKERRPPWIYLGPLAPSNTQR